MARQIWRKLGAFLRLSNGAHALTAPFFNNSPSRTALRLRAFKRSRGEAPRGAIGLANDMDMSIATKHQADTAAGAAGRALPREFLSFKLGAEEYGIDILRVQEIRSYEEPTRIANAPPFVKGVVNLRGVIVPVFDMRLKFNLAEARCDHLTVIVVLNLGDERVVGLVVDGVSDVITPTAEQLRPVPQLNAAVDTDHLLAIGTIDKRMLMLLDIDRLMAGVDMGAVLQSAMQ